MKTFTSRFSAKVLVIFLSVSMAVTQVLPYGFAAEQDRSAVLDPINGINVPVVSAEEPLREVEKPLERGDALLGDPTANFLESSLTLSKTISEIQVDPPIEDKIDLDQLEVEAVKNKLSELLNLNDEQRKAIEVVLAEKSQWNNGCVGWNIPDQVCAMAIVDGYRVALKLYGNEYEFRAGRLDPEKKMAIIAINDLAAQGVPLEGIVIQSSGLESEEWNGQPVVFQVVLSKDEKKWTYHIDYWSGKILPQSENPAETARKAALGELVGNLGISERQLQDWLDRGLVTIKIHQWDNITSAVVYFDPSIRSYVIEKSRMNLLGRLTLPSLAEFAFDSEYRPLDAHLRYERGSDSGEISAIQEIDAYYENGRLQTVKLYDGPQMVCMGPGCAPPGRLIKEINYRYWRMCEINEICTQSFGQDTAEIKYYTFDKITRRMVTFNSGGLMMYGVPGGEILSIQEFGKDAKGNEVLLVTDEFAYSQKWLWPYDLNDRLSNTCVTNQDGQMVGCSRPRPIYPGVLEKIIRRDANGNILSTIELGNQGPYFWTGLLGQLDQNHTTDSVSLKLFEEPLAEEQVFLPKLYPYPYPSLKYGYAVVVLPDGTRREVWYKDMESLLDQTRKIEASQPGPVQKLVLADLSKLTGLSLDQLKNLIESAVFDPERLSITIRFKDGNMGSGRIIDVLGAGNLPQEAVYYLGEMMVPEVCTDSIPPSCWGPKYQIINKAVMKWKENNFTTLSAEITYSSGSVTIVSGDLAYNGVSSEISKIDWTRVTDVCGFTQDCKAPAQLENLYRDVYMKSRDNEITIHRNPIGPEPVISMTSEPIIRPADLTHVSLEWDLDSQRHLLTMTLEKLEDGEYHITKLEEYGADGNVLATTQFDYLSLHQIGCPMNGPCVGNVFVIFQGMTRSDANGQWLSTTSISGFVDGSNAMVDVGDGEVHPVNYTTLENLIEQIRKIEEENVPIVKMKKFVLADLSKLTGLSLDALNGLIASISVDPETRIVSIQLKEGQMGNGRLIDVLGDGKLPSTIVYRLERLNVACFVAPCPEQYRIQSAQMRWNESRTSALVADISYAGDGRMVSIDWTHEDMVEITMCLGGTPENRCAIQRKSWATRGKMLYRENYHYGDSTITITRESAIISEDGSRRLQAIMTLEKLEDGEYHITKLEEYDGDGKTVKAVSRFVYEPLEKMTAEREIACNPAYDPNCVDTRPDCFVAGPGCKGWFPEEPLFTIPAPVSLVGIERVDAYGRWLSTTKIEGATAIVDVGDGQNNKFEFTTLENLLEQIRKIEEDYAVVKQLRQTVIGDLSMTFGIKADLLKQWLEEGSITITVDTVTRKIAVKFSGELQGRSFKGGIVDPLGEFIIPAEIRYHYAGPDMIRKTSLEAGDAENPVGEEKPLAAPNFWIDINWSYYRLTSAEVIYGEKVWVKEYNGNVFGIGYMKIEYSKYGFDRPHTDVTHIWMYDGDPNTKCGDSKCTTHLVKEVVDSVWHPCGLIMCLDSMPSHSATVAYPLSTDVTKRTVSYNVWQQDKGPFGSILNVVEFVKGADGREVLYAINEFIYGVINSGGEFASCGEKEICSGSSLMWIVRKNKDGRELSRIDLLPVHTELEKRSARVILPNGIETTVSYMTLEDLFDQVRGIEPVIVHQSAFGSGGRVVIEKTFPNGKEMLTAKIQLKSASAADKDGYQTVLSVVVASYQITKTGLVITGRDGRKFTLLSKQQEIQIEERVTSEVYGGAVLIKQTAQKVIGGQLKTVAENWLKAVKSLVYDSAKRSYKWIEVLRSVQNVKYAYDSKGKLVSETITRQLEDGSYVSLNLNLLTKMTIVTAYSASGRAVFGKILKNAELRTEASGLLRSISALVGFKQQTVIEVTSSRVKF